VLLAIFPTTKSIISTAGSVGDSAKESLFGVMKLSIVSGLLISKYDV
jgi:hypothetical protein